MELVFAFVKSIRYSLCPILNVSRMKWKSHLPSTRKLNTNPITSWLQDWMNVTSAADRKNNP